MVERAFQEVVERAFQEVVEEVEYSGLEVENDHIWGEW